ncbi:glycine amidinotransferase [Streptomyces nojiriensis]|uniref:glycine amidinotransferase n=1 Tax=Streptomyces nojiriensis TaxID=66374 RepID=UPI002E1711B0
MRLNGYDGFTRLREVIVGSGTGYTGHDRDLSFELFHQENLLRYGTWHYPRLVGGAAPERRTVHPRYVEELVEDVEGLAATLASLGVTVHRPLPLPPGAAPVTGPGWTATATPALNIRDNTLIVGDEIIETPPVIRSRLLESRLLAPLFRRCFDAGAGWTVMPRPGLTDASFDLSYARHAAAALGANPVPDPRPGPYDAGHEMMLDGAQVLRLGRDLVVNTAQANHHLAADWLERHLRGRFTVHRVDRMADSHIDATLLALRPGVFLARHDRVRDLLPRPLQGWKFIVPPEPDPAAFPAYGPRDLLLTSPYIDLNVLSVDESTVLVNAAATGVRTVLEAHGFTVVPVRHRHRRLFGGGLHCLTLDTVRDGGPEDYLT